MSIMDNTQEICQSIAPAQQNFKTATNFELHKPDAKYAIEEIEYRSRGQASNPEWMACRYGRVTGSICGKIMHASSPTFRGKRDSALSTIAEDIIRPRKFTSAATEWGKVNERTAIKQYQLDKTVFSDGSSLNDNCGLHVHPRYHWTGVSPDGLVTTKEGHKILLEVKCPYSQRLSPNFEAPTFYLKKNKDTHILDMKKAQGRNYYYQIQLSLAILNIDVAHLYIWTPTQAITLEVRRQCELGEKKMLQCLSKFYEHFVRQRVDLDRYRAVRDRGVKRPADDDIAAEHSTLPKRKQRGTYYVCTCD